MGPVEYIKNQLGKDLALQTIATASYISCFHLHRLCGRNRLCAAEYKMDPMAAMQCLSGSGRTLRFPF